MRVYLAVTLVALAGCGSSNNANDMSMSNNDMTMSAADMAERTTCSIQMQDCGTGMKCIPTVSGQMLVGKCGADGTVAEGSSCMQQQSMTQLLDDCVAGNICDNTGTGNDATFACRKICTADSGCTGGQRCLGFGSFGICVPTCTPFMSGGCPAGSDCGGNFDDVSATMSMETGFFVCKHTGAAGLYGDCMGDSDCAAGLWCDNYQGGTQTCMQLCDGTHACTQPPADAGITTVGCNAFSDQAGKGYCYQQ